MPGPLAEPLSGSEVRVLRYLPTNLTAPEIARELSVSPNTVRTHIKSLYAKLGTHGRATAVERARAQRSGLPLVRVGARTCVDAQLHLERHADRFSPGVADQARAKTGSCRRSASQIASRRAVRTATVKFCEGRDSLGHSPDRGLCDRRPGVYTVVRPAN